MPPSTGGVAPVGQLFTLVNGERFCPALFPGGNLSPDPLAKSRRRPPLGVGGSLSRLLWGFFALPLGLFPPAGLQTWQDAKSASPSALALAWSGLLASSGVRRWWGQGLGFSGSVKGLGCQGLGPPQAGCVAPLTSWGAFFPPPLTGSEKLRSTLDAATNGGLCFPPGPASTGFSGPLPSAPAWPLLPHVAPSG